MISLGGSKKTILVLSNYTPTKRNSVGYPCCTLCPTKKGESSTNPKLIPENVHFFICFSWYKLVGFQLQVAEIWAQELVGCLRKLHDKLARNSLMAKNNVYLKKTVGKTRGERLYIIYMYIYIMFIIHIHLYIHIHIHVYIYTHKT